ncbi:MAG TPA: metal-sulfur cluster assembly factor [Chloroflexota bacterium]
MISALEQRLMNALRDVEDPELPLNVVDLGLIVALSVRDRTATVDMTFTAMGCPAMDMLIDDVRTRLSLEEDIDDVKVTVVWDPIWSVERISHEGKAALRDFGIAI